MSNSLRHCRELEQGGILLFPQSPCAPEEDDRRFLLEVRQAAGGHHKNIAYRPAEDRVTGYAGGADAERLHRVLREYFQRATDFLRKLLPPYAQAWRMDYASFRPQEEQGRQVRQRARNDLLHVDAFPTRPTNGDLILRIFSNINPTEPRRWVTGEAFPKLVERLGDTPGFPEIRPVSGSPMARLGRACRRMASATGLPLRVRSPYDEFMLTLHHWLKENDEYQARSPRKSWDFPPGSTWIVLTDVVPHAALSGRFALEQTYLVSRDSLVLPDLAPASVLERRCGGPVTFATSERRRAA